MLKKALALGLLAVAAAGLSAKLWSQDKTATTRPAGAEERTYDFDGNDSLSGWTLTGEAKLDMAKGREGKGGALKVGPGGKAVVKLRDKDESGKVDIWVYDDGTKPEDSNANRPGPRWGIVQSDGKMLVVAILYARYVSGSTGYTAITSDGKKWYSNLQWLGGKRTPAGWHKWTFDFDAEKGLLKILRDGKPIPTDESHWKPAESGIKGFNTIAFWGDSAEKGQTFWVADVTYTPAAAPKAAETKPAVAK